MIFSVTSDTRTLDNVILMENEIFSHAQYMRYIYVYVCGSSNYNIEIETITVSAI